MIRTRIAPSPTGYLHLGTARTALFNYLWAKKNQGKFILRIEDTDQQRSKKEFEEDILLSLKWLGLNWDEGPDIGGEFAPYRQSERTNIYRQYLEQLLREGKAFFCYHTKEELAQEREKQKLANRPQIHICSHKNDSPKNFGEKQGVIRFNNPGGTIEFNDLIRGKVRFDASLLGDFVLAKSLDSPLYNFSVVIDDWSMKINYVIRGEDHLSNTPKQILVQQALNIPQPNYAHIPLILGPDKSKLSKRHGAMPVLEYRQMGYLPQAVINFLVLLGWHPQEEKEVLEMADLIQEFSLEKIQKSGAIFNLEKLDYLNHYYIQKLPVDEYWQHCQLYLKDVYPAKFNQNEDFFKKASFLFRERLKKFSEISGLISFLVELPDYQAEDLIWKKSSVGETKKILLLVIDKLENQNILTSETVKSELKNLADQFGIGNVFWPIRVALSGQKSSPPPEEIAIILGKEECLNRLKWAQKKLEI
ncbi:MAG TPA: glutamate--tRNA ligase [Candidatus Portnoybacteria bacterium]|nr:glutamate--tRNA ligase [Candidatus Portnoybacteria bacterium]